MIIEAAKNGKKKMRVRSQKTPSAKVKGPVMKDSAAKDYVVIDHPKSGETLTHSYYAVRVGASWGQPEISIDGSNWKACRHAAGYFWFDWSPIPPGQHKLTARIKAADGKFKSSKAVQCKMK